MPCPGRPVPPRPFPLVALEPLLWDKGRTRSQCGTFGQILNLLSDLGQAVEPLCAAVPSFVNWVGGLLCGPEAVDTKGPSAGPGSWSKEAAEIPRLSRADLPERRSQACCVVSSHRPKMGETWLVSSPSFHPH